MTQNNSTPSENSGAYRVVIEEWCRYEIDIDQAQDKHHAYRLAKDLLLQCSSNGVLLNTGIERIEANPLPPS